MRRGVGPVAGQLDLVRPFEGCLGGQGVLADVHKNRPRPPSACQVERLGDHARDLRGIGDEVVVLDDRHGDAGDVSFLEGVCADRGTRHLAGDRDDRDRVHVGIGDGCDEVRGAGAGGGHADTDLAGGLRVPLGRVAGGLLVADEDVAHLLGVHQRVVRGQDRPARDAEYRVHASMLQ